MDCLENQRYDLYKYMLIERGMLDNRITSSIENVINSIAEKVGSPNYQRTPIFKKKYNNKLKFNNKISNEDLILMTNFKKTVLDKNENQEEINLDRVRSNLNKLTETNIDEIYENIKTLIDSSFLNNDDMLKQVGSIVFEIGKNSYFLSSTYANIFSKLIKNYPVMNDSYTIIVNDYITLFDNIKYISPDENYDLFCEYNKNNEKIKSYSKFLVNMMLNGLIDVEFINDISERLMDKFMDVINEKDYENNAELIMDNIIIIYSLGYNKFDSKNIYNKLIEITEYNIKDYKSLTNKIKFKCLDMIEELE